jgi:arylsulfatase A-like enzyme
VDLCGLPGIPGAQGRSFRTVLDGSEDDTHWKNAYAEFYSQRFFFTQRVVWHDDWKYVFTPGGKDELYDLASDPYERCNRIDDETCKPKLHMLCKQMWETMSRIGDDSLLNTQYATLRTAPVGPLGLKVET